MNVRILLPRSPETIVWPEGVSFPNVGDDIHVSGHLSSLTVSKKTFHIVNGKVDTLTIHYCIVAGICLKSLRISCRAVPKICHLDQTDSTTAFARYSLPAAPCFSLSSP